MADPQPDTTTLVVLGLVALHPGSGYDLARLAERSVGYLWTPSRSQIYKVLPRLVAHRLATAKTVRQPDRPDKALYSITPAGRRVLRRWLSQVEVEPSGGANMFALKLFFCDLVPPRTAQAQLDGYRRFLESRLKRFQAMLRVPAQGENIFPQLVLARAITRIEATLAWVDQSSATLSAARPNPRPRPPRGRATGKQRAGSERGKVGNRGKQR
jgi:PadR family transcriptional regulator, regulatory protein AphA